MDLYRNYLAQTHSHTTEPRKEREKTKSSKSQTLLDLSNGKRRVQPLGTSPGAIENGVATVERHAVVEGVLALGRLLVARVGDPAVRLQQHGGAQVLFAVPPVRGARGATAGA